MLESILKIVAFGFKVIMSVLEVNRCVLWARLGGPADGGAIHGTGLFQYDLYGAVHV